ncbi:unnamed protein product [Schistosoma curassoni]|uniref:Uncharacterized protein n=1 Tax=Schistosoma curassoni TaxID=6186 RepID=A0A183JEJ5_9TREM|nr:unnamed protein product [Schistosoma curassoni]
MASLFRKGTISKVTLNVSILAFNIFVLMVLIPHSTCVCSVNPSLFINILVNFFDKIL